MPPSRSVFNPSEWDLGSYWAFGTKTAPSSFLCQCSGALFIISLMDCSSGCRLVLMCVSVCLHFRLEEEKAKAEAEAQAKAQQQIQAEVHKVLEKEQLALQQTLKDVIMQVIMHLYDVTHIWLECVWIYAVAIKNLLVLVSYNSFMNLCRVSSVLTMPVWSNLVDSTVTMIKWLLKINEWIIS